MSIIIDVVLLAKSYVPHNFNKYYKELELTPVTKKNIFTYLCLIIAEDHSDICATRRVLPMRHKQNRLYSQRKK